MEADESVMERAPSHNNKADRAVAIGDRMGQAYYYHHAGAAGKEGGCQLPATRTGKGILSFGQP